MLVVLGLGVRKGWGVQIGAGVLVQKRVWKQENITTLKELFSILYKNRIFQCMGKVLCVKCQRCAFKISKVPFHIPSKILYPYNKNVWFIQKWKLKSFLIFITRAFCPKKSLHCFPPTIVIVTPLVISCYDKICLEEVLLYILESNALAG